MSKFFWWQGQGEDDIYRHPDQAESETCLKLMMWIKNVNKLQNMRVTALFLQASSLKFYFEYQVTQAVCCSV